ncbi:response regulator [Kamptonema formosum]|uniref:response regulator n=1 Tax=Kamptonema formosum TaxID=331992 RepID=UPI000348377B|nr:PleD family two-component system response regulator [Oscillatoria sp. PCC 10802]
MSTLIGANTTPSVSEPPLVLVIEDDRTTRMLLRRAMEKEGYRVAEAADGKQGLADYTRLQPDIVLLDAVMPVMDGFTCCEQVRLLGDGDSTPVLMITSLDDPQSVDRAFEAGAADYVTKPIHWTVLRQRVRRLIHQAHLYRQMEAANRELQRLASVDGLTGVANRRRFDEMLECEWLRLARDRQPLSLILCDVDFFKAYNDTYGHIAGDRCLQLVAGAISQAVRHPADLVARYGGEEFAVVLPHTDSAGAVHVAEQIRMNVAALGIVRGAAAAGVATGGAATSGRPYGDRLVTLSLGVATAIPLPHSTPAVLIASADRALYDAKASGRNCAVLMQ